MYGVWDDKAFKIESGNQNKYQIIRWIGNGSYGKVFLGVIEERYECAIKIFSSFSECTLKREVYFLSQLQHPNIVKLYDVIENEQQNQSIIMEYIHNTPLNQVSKKLTLKEVKILFVQLLKAVNYIHSKNIMHRDIKPSNIMFNYNNMTLKLIDFGLADYYIQNTKYSIHVGSINYKAPELLLHIHYYTPSIDIWSCGCVLAEMIIRNYPLFEGECLNDILEEIIKLEGTVVLTDFLRKEHIQISRCQALHLVGRKTRSIREYTDPVFQKKQTPGLIHLLKELLEFNYHKRPSTSYLLKHLTEFLN
ncbi:casein kinase II subunit alpha, putative [Entamoeba dispar SAW760]|uniref:non-specific serine/threonine protein kinase n=1 Tax=Entamoeba dispar (strain ATCC PRA-260 / SAW760) TaxID=370354 RepID=B0E630_ENTDS|nr:casein kinase II subunit alpha, putative [Entamoeba dispar SAW760]EDR30003.1 casein kinase II subunit alpha, putative [Entamoeba dispar SAW760]|eukprot:EDR30003.1 casein kinase II subunit alpha, putative [Entamoeba dispar SAW760]